jgi:hypothetical protein
MSMTQLPPLHYQPTYPTTHEAKSELTSLSNRLATGQDLESLKTDVLGFIEEFKALIEGNTLEKLEAAIENLRRNEPTMEGFREAINQIIGILMEVFGGSTEN